MVSLVYKELGIKLPRVAGEQMKFGKAVKINDIKPGDIIGMKSNGPTGNHVVIVDRVENGLIHVINARGKKYGVIKSTVNPKDILTVRRVYS
ncbi:MAG: NlpC/P60 family protein [Prevotella sp.]|nr:NlpC/P60 family protein [Prevotella sp.]